jgi:hypothetical protein
MSGSRSRSNTSQKILQRRESNKDLWLCSQEVWPLDHRGGHICRQICQQNYTRQVQRYSNETVLEMRDDSEHNVDTTIIVRGRIKLTWIGNRMRAPEFRRVRSYGICGWQSELGHVFSEYFGFPCQSFHRLLHNHHHPGLVQQAK